MSSRLFFGLLLSMAPLLSGCGTAINTFVAHPPDARTQIYGGVKLDAGVLGHAFDSERNGNDDGPLDRARWVPLVIVDLPLSFVGDTLMLPFTVRAAILQD